MGGRREEERKKAVWAERYLLHLPFRNPPPSPSPGHRFLVPVSTTTQSRKLPAPTPSCVETAEFHLHSDVLLQASGGGSQFRCLRQDGPLHFRPGFGNFKHTLLPSARGLGRLVFSPAVLTGQLGSDGTPLHQPCVMDGWRIIKMSPHLPPLQLASARRVLGPLPTRPGALCLRLLVPARPPCQLLGPPPCATNPCVGKRLEARWETPKP